MNSKMERLHIAGRQAVKESLVSDGWKVLFENRNREDPVDIRAVKGVDKILVHILLNSNGSADDEQLQKLALLKKRADESNAYAFKVTVEIDNDEILKDIRFTQLI